MRKVVYEMMVSLDGFIEGRDPELDWAIIDEELHRFANDESDAASAILYGRRLYETMAGYWPTAHTNPASRDFELDFQRIWLDTPKIVYSKTLEKVDWNSTLVRDVVAEEIAELKTQPGGDMFLAGPGLALTFMELGLIDEYRLIVHPVILGGGKPYFPLTADTTKLRLLETRTFGSGVIYLRYAVP